MRVGTVWEWINLVCSYFNFLHTIAVFSCEETSAYRDRIHRVMWYTNTDKLQWCDILTTNRQPTDDSVFCNFISSNHLLIIFFKSADVSNTYIHIESLDFGIHSMRESDFDFFSSAVQYSVQSFSSKDKVLVLSSSVRLKSDSLNKQYQISYLTQLLSRAICMKLSLSLDEWNIKNSSEAETWITSQIFYLSIFRLDYFCTEYSINSDVVGRKLFQG